jgi:RNA-dependent RNA polymerase
MVRASLHYWHCINTAYITGDEYNVILNRDLHPREVYPPAEYPPAEIRTLEHPCTIRDIADWVAEYINSDILVSKL